MNLSELRLMTEAKIEAATQKVALLFPDQVDLSYLDLLDSALSDLEEIGDMKRQLDTVYSSSFLSDASMTLSETNVIVKNISERINILNKLTQHLVEKNADQMVIGSINAKRSHLVSLREKLRKAWSEKESSIMVVYGDEDINSSQEIKVSKKIDPVFVLEPETKQKVVDQLCPICCSKKREGVESLWVQSGGNVMATLSNSVNSGFIPGSSTPNHVRLHFDKHVGYDLQMVGRLS